VENIDAILERVSGYNSTIIEAYQKILKIEVNVISLLIGSGILFPILGLVMILFPRSIVFICFVFLAFLLPLSIIIYRHIIIYPKIKRIERDAEKISWFFVFYNRYAYTTKQITIVMLIVFGTGFFVILYGAWYLGELYYFVYKSFIMFLFTIFVCFGSPIILPKLIKRDLEKEGFTFRRIFKGNVHEIWHKISQGLNLEEIRKSEYMLGKRVYYQLSIPKQNMTITVFHDKKDTNSVIIQISGVKKNNLDYAINIMKKIEKLAS